VCAVALTREEVEHVALLARLGLSDEELTTLADQLSAILDHMRAINELETSEIPPTAQVIPLRNVMRPDVPSESLSVEAVLQNAPRVDGNYFRVPPVLD
jgi:aspartyl-tRNA(Asn)/glutamyl-tRNA(Gln) amidotransferase subunit C